VPWTSTSALYRKISFGLVLTDVLALEAAIVSTRALDNKALASGRALIGLLLVAPVVFVAVFAMFHLYPAGRLTPAEEFRRLIPATAVAAAVRLLVVPLIGHAQEQLLSQARLCCGAGTRIFPWDAGAIEGTLALRGPARQRPQGRQG